MFERSKLFERLRHYYLESARERGKVVLISGGVATGKTEFAYRFAQYARGSGALLLNATASAQDRSVRMGVVGQLFSSADLPPAVAQVVEDVTGLAAGTGGAGGRAPADPTEDLLVQRACAALLKLARSCPLVIAVDDVHFADETSVRTLLALQRRIGMARVLLLLNQRDSADRRQARLRAELTRQPYFRLIRLEPLSPEGVKRLIEADLGSPSCPAHLTTEFHRLSGGNPLIVRALIDDHRAGRGRRGRGPVIGGSFEETVLMCLHRHDAGAVRTARAAAVLGPRATAETIARLTGEPDGTVAAALERLEAGGLVQGPQFRHPRARSAVLRDLPPDLSAALRLRAAEVLESEHAPLVEIAAQLVQAGSPPPARYVHVLERAAQQECAGGDAEQAVRCLRLALRGRLSDRKAASLTASLARVQWLMNPTGMSEQLDVLVAADAAGHLDPVDALMTVRALAWVGRHAEAAAVLERAAGRTVPAGAADLRLTVAWLRRRHPNVLTAVT
ncbi:ATP-binding protein, partial [Nonomuraea terrae]